MMTPVSTVDTLSGFIGTHLPEVSRALERHVRTAAAEIPAAGNDYRGLWHSLGEQFEGGKNLRPSLTLAAYAGLGGDDPAAVIPVAAAMEMLHTAMLVHDDILDHDEVRRGRPNIAGTRRRELEGSALTKDQVDDHVQAAALLGGNLALSSTYDLISRAALPAHHRIACLDLVTTAIRATIAGELLDMYANVSEPRDADSLLVAELKTATYSFVVPLHAGAQLAGADPTMVGHLDKIGTSLGLSFQLVDDDLGVFGDPAVTGKSVLSDLRAGKRTELLRQAFTLADAAGQQVLAANVGNRELDEAGAAQVRQVLEDCGARSETLRIARRHARSAGRLASERVSAPLSGYLGRLIDLLEARTS